ncbi:histidine kinase [Streptomyces sp. NPDC001941]|uniref:sensor histidine kinase n=1 Tax=Streptomyces sp. NPDC001941 TaxID=3154659 RepID=UPI00332A6D4A
MHVSSRTPESPVPSPDGMRRARAAAVALVVAGAVALECLDFVAGFPHGSWLPLVSGLLAVGLNVVPLPWPDVARQEAARAGAGVVLSLCVTAGMLLAGAPAGPWGALESGALLLLLVPLVRRDRGRGIGWLAWALSLSVLASPLRVTPGVEDLRWSAVLAGAAGGAVLLGLKLRALDERRRRAVTAVRQHERLDLSRDLHDFVAHHVTGIVVQAQAAQAVLRDDPEGAREALRRIEAAGVETVEAMHRAVRSLREDGGVRPLPPGALVPELERLAGARGAHLEADEAVRGAAPDPGTAAAVLCVVQEALTNVDRHALGAEDVLVRVTLRGDRLRVRVGNGPAPDPLLPPLARGGFGLLGVRERVEAAGGTLRAGPTACGGWLVRADVPLPGRSGAPGPVPPRPDPGRSHPYGTGDVRP